MTNKKSLEDFSDGELAAEINRRKAAKEREEAALRAKRARIDNLPENVEKRKRKAEEARFNTVANHMKNSYSLDEEGIWKIYGEDPNCDLGGSHHEPYLGKVEGTLKNAIKHAIKMPNFFTWGRGGRIIKSERETIVKV
jgi:hypothetical protein